jgi:hypothetical protein
MTRFAVSTTKRTLSVSVPSRSQEDGPKRHAVTRGPNALQRLRRRTVTAAAGSMGSVSAPRTVDHGFLSEAHERFELVVESVGILQARVDDLEAQ